VHVTKGFILLPKQAQTYENSIVLGLNGQNAELRPLLINSTLCPSLVDFF
jgi:hypothetical protein